MTQKNNTTQTTRTLFSSIQNGESHALEQYLIEGGHPDLQNGRGHSLLTWACSFFNKGALQLLIEHNANLNKVDKKIRTPIDECIDNGFLDAIKLLLDAGANPNTANNLGCKALFETIRKSYHVETRLLIEHGADINGIFGPEINVWSAAQTDESFNTLLGVGVDPLLKDGKGRTALHLAAYRGLTNTVKSLVQQYNVNPNTRDNQGNTPLMGAASRGRAEACQMLLDLGADITLMNDIGELAHMLINREAIFTPKNTEHLNVIFAVAKKEVLEEMLTPRKDVMRPTSGKPKI